MPRYKLEWRQTNDGEEPPAFLHRVVTTTSADNLKRIAAISRERAWRREFRVTQGDCEIFTNLHEIENWQPQHVRLPATSSAHFWRRDLQRDLVVDRLVAAVSEGAHAAVAAGVLLAGDADALVRLTRSLVRRPSL